jgi:hypothetical protein
MGTSTNRRRVIGRTLRRSRRLSTRGAAAPGTGKATGPLQAIEENTVVSLVEPSSALRSATLRHFADSPFKKRRGSAAGREAASGAQGKKRRRESQADKASTGANSSSSSGESKRRREMLALLDDLEAQGACLSVMCIVLEQELTARVLLSPEQCRSGARTC